MPLTKTRSLMTDFATALSLPSLPPDDNGGYQVTVGDDDATVSMYGGDDETVLAVAPVGPLPTQIDYALVSYLFRKNMFNSDLTPFQIGLDEGGGLILWARLIIDELTGETLANLVDAVADQVTEIRAQIFGDDEST